MHLSHFGEIYSEIEYFLTFRAVLQQWNQLLVISGGGEHSSAGGIQEKIQQPSVRYTLIWVTSWGAVWT